MNAFDKYRVEFSASLIVRGHAAALPARNFLRAAGQIPGGIIIDLRFLIEIQGPESRCFQHSNRPKLLDSL